VASLNLNLGFRGILNFATTALFGLGAYIALICLIAGFPLTQIFIVVGFASVLLGVAISKMTIKLSNDNLALVLFMLLLVIQNLVTNWKSLTGGSFGLSIFSLPYRSSELSWFLENLLWLSLFYSFLVISFFLIVSRSKIGLSWLSTRDNLKLSKSLGQKWELWRTLNITFASLATSFSGVFYVLYIGYIDPSLFGLNLLVLIISMAVLGGLESWKGVFFGSLILTVIPELLRFFPITNIQAAPLRNILYGTLLLICLIYKPYGLFGKFKIG
jgi:branched-chain amino acid transport system permease protein